jgi:condensin complex subunit 3
MASRFISKLLRHLLSGMEAKDKNVRFRVTLMTVSLINGLGELEWVHGAPLFLTHQ